MIPIITTVTIVNNKNKDNNNKDAIMFLQLNIKEIILIAELNIKLRNLKIILRYIYYRSIFKSGDLRNCKILKNETYLAIYNKLYKKQICRKSSHVF